VVVRFRASGNIGQSGEPSDRDAGKSLTFAVAGIRSLQTGGRQYLRANKR